jgi:organic radical activating enzyme
MKLAEPIFYSVQGEGRHIGRPSIFIRLAECNLRCSFCDTKYSWAKGKEISIGKVIKEIEDYGCKNIVITGGEPLLQQKEISELIQRLPDNYRFEIETNGTIWPDLPASIEYNVSPKMSNSDNFVGIREKPTVLNYFSSNNKAIFKFVVKEKSDLEEVLEYVTKYNIEKEHVYLMPEGITPEDLREKQKWLVEICKNYQFNLTPRMHIEIWGNVKGV